MVRKAEDECAEWKSRAANAYTQYQYLQEALTEVEVKE